MDGQNVTRILSPRDFPSDVSKSMKQNANPKMAIKLSQVCKYFQRKNGFPFLDVINFLKESLFPHIPLLPEKLNHIHTSHRPVIALFDHFSVIFLHSAAQGGYEFVDRWNGAHGNYLFISLDQTHPQIGLHALNVFSIQPSYVVFDIINILSMPAGNIRTNKLWSFKFIDADRSRYPNAMIEFNTPTGKKLARPALFMAALIKAHINAIVDEIGGERPTELVFCLPFSRYNVEQKARIFRGLEDACRILKITCQFIEV